MGSALPRQHHRAEPATAAAAPTRQAAAGPAGGSCHPSYSPCVPNSASDLDCADVGHPVSVPGSDPYRLDGDGDGSGCESS